MRDDVRTPVVIEIFVRPPNMWMRIYCALMSLLLSCLSVLGAIVDLDHSVPFVARLGIGVACVVAVGLAVSLVFCVGTQGGGGHLTITPTQLLIEVPVLSSRGWEIPLSEVRRIGHGEGRPIETIVSFSSEGVNLSIHLSHPSRLPTVKPRWSTWLVVTFRGSPIRWPFVAASTSVGFEAMLTPDMCAYLDRQLWKPDAEIGGRPSPDCGPGFQ